MIERPLYIDKIMKYAGTPFVKVLCGIRRSGKSTILQMIADEFRKRGIPESCIIQYRFDSLEYDNLKTAKALYTEIKKRLVPGLRAYIFLDEIQEVADWEKAVNSLMQDFDTDIYVTGSNSRMMSSEIATYLTGRYVSFTVYPLSFAEYLDFRKQYTTPSDTHTELARYLKFGGFPALHLRSYTQEEAYTIVYDIYNSVIFSDIVKRSQIRKIDQLERIVKYILFNTGSLFSSLAVSKYLKSEHRTIDDETVYSYIAKLESAFILNRCSRYDVRGKEILKTQEKLYPADPALRYSVLGYSPDTTAVMLENIVYIELLRRGYTVYTGKDDTAEIDFIGMKNGEKIYIQVSQQISSAETEQREYGRLLGIHDNYPKYVLCADEFAGGNHEGIRTMHIADFLLE
jgi:uncharacterized protein